jgi:hypothetical protein
MLWPVTAVRRRVRPVVPSDRAERWAFPAVSSSASRAATAVAVAVVAASSCPEQKRLLRLGLTALPQM